MKTIKGPAIFLAQFAGDKAPFDNLDNPCDRKNNCFIDGAKARHLNWTHVNDDGSAYQSENNNFYTPKTSMT